MRVNHSCIDGQRVWRGDSSHVSLRRCDCVPCSELDLSSNVVSSLPRDMSALANLTVLNLDDNPIR